MTQRLLFLGIFWTGLFLTAEAQIEDYYRPYKRQKTVFLTHPDLVRSDSHWYIGIEGGGKWNGATLSDNLYGLLASKSGTFDSYAGGHLGYSHNLQWSIESGYIHNPSNAFLLVNAVRGFRVRVNELQHSIPLRFKWRLFRLGVVQKQSGIYIGGGVLWTPSRKYEVTEAFSLAGLTRSSGSRTSLDTILVENQTFSTGKAKLELEGSLEFVGRVATHIEFVAYGRVHYAGASALRSDSQFYINHIREASSSLILRPVSYQFGIAIRYIYGMRKEYRSRFEE
ncbi:hypothetical protein [Runella sp.]|uniref:hypothetical protein n=1 Tax=Runella sp. TaxID=1960881 RepID=UPI003D0F0399